MTRRLALLPALLLLAFAGCESSTGLDCSPSTSLDCGQPPFRSYVLSVHVSSEAGAAVPHATVRVEARSGCCGGFFWEETTNAQGLAVFDFSYQGEALRPPLPITIHVTPPEGSVLSASPVVADTVVMSSLGTMRVVPITLTPSES